MALATDLTTSMTECLKELHMPTVRECYREQADCARRESLTYEQYLLDLMEREREVRRQNRIARLLRQPKLPLQKTLEAFDRKRLPRTVNAHVDVLLEGSFLDRTENVLAFGNAGSGKTHLLCAIGQELVHQDRRVLFTPCNLLVQELLIAKGGSVGLKFDQAPTDLSSAQRWILAHTTSPASRNSTFVNRLSSINCLTGSVQRIHPNP